MPLSCKRPVRQSSSRKKNLTGDGLVKTVETLLTSPGKLAEMGANAKTLGNPHSLDLITEKLLKLVNG